jgi:NADPH:quinone reductase-like Zn-dependent oxidoreductase
LTGAFAELALLEGHSASVIPDGVDFAASAAF